MNMPADPATQVVIVGGGPVGLGLAIELGQRGVRCALIERFVSPQPIPKGQNLTQRTLEHFYFWGAEAELRAARTVPSSYGIGGITSYGTLLSGYRYDWLQRELVRPYYFKDNERLPQYATEAVLRHRLSQVPNVETVYGWSASAIAQDADGVEVTISERNSARQRMLRADYVIGCDGSRSTVREAAGITQTLTDHDRLMVLLVFRSTGLHKLLERYPDKCFYNVLHPELKGYWKFFGRVDLGTTWFFHAPVPLGTTKDNFDFRGLLHGAVGEEFDVALDHIGFWELRVAIADQYRSGRVFIAGDAAHSHPPYGGFGLNNGLEDAVNLGWKLAARLDGWGGDTLLASYSDERRPIFKEVAEDFIAARIRNDGAFLNRYNPTRDKAEFETAWKGQESDVGNRAQVYEPSYEGSPVVIGPPGGVSTAHGKHVFKARAGHHLVPQKLSSGRDVFEELGRGFTLFAFDADDAAVRAFEQAAAALNVPLKIVRDTYADGRTKYETRMILVRPDQFIVWIGDKAPADAGAIMRKVAGRG